jgi:glycosyltransferase involved in cell wall biosynthesis
MVKFSIVIITLNEERNIARCLDSVKNVADEIVIVDSNSTDRTAAIATGHGARVIQRAFTGYGEQKNFAMQQASHDWVLSLDADEALTPELEASILAVKQSPEQNAYEMSRLTNYCGKWIRHCGWYPDKKLRLFDRTKGEWKRAKIHEYWELYDTTAPIGQLRGDLLHYSYYTINDHTAGISHFTELAAREAAMNGKDCSLLKVLLGPKWNFITTYIIRLGILDGYYGFMIAKLSAYATFVKYAKTRQYAALKRAGKL